MQQQQQQQTPTPMGTIIDHSPHPPTCVWVGGYSFRLTHSSCCPCHFHSLCHLFHHLCC